MMKIKDLYKMMASHEAIKGLELKKMINSFDEEDLIEFEQQSFNISIDNFPKLIDNSENFDEIEVTFDERNN